MNKRRRFYGKALHNDIDGAYFASMLAKRTLSIQRTKILSYNRRLSLKKEIKLHAIALKEETLGIDKFVFLTTPVNQYEDFFEDTFFVVEC